MALCSPLFNADRSNEHQPTPPLPSHRGPPSLSLSHIRHQMRHCSRRVATINLYALSLSPFRSVSISRFCFGLAFYRIVSVTPIWHDTSPCQRLVLLDSRLESWIRSCQCIYFFLVYIHATADLPSWRHGGKSFGCWFSSTVFPRLNKNFRITNSPQ